MRKRTNRSTLKPPRARSGFTLVELLVTVGLIVILISILIPTVSRVRQASWASNTQSQIAGLAAAIERYRLDFGAYPGPLHNDAIIFDTHNVENISGRITMAENLVLGLLGGLHVHDDGEVEFHSESVGRGPENLNLAAPHRRFEPYVERQDLSAGRFSDDAGSANDSSIPEFVDRFPNPMPILYLRARVGSDGIISNEGGAQYDLQQIIAYTDSNIGVGKDLDETQYVNADFPDHGLRTVDPDAVLSPRGDPDFVYPYDAHPYLRHPSLPNTPRQRDGFILISPGRDRVYGTEHDITSFGSLD